MCMLRRSTLILPFDLAGYRLLIYSAAILCCLLPPAIWTLSLAKWKNLIKSSDTIEYVRWKIKERVLAVVWCRVNCRMYIINASEWKMAEGKGKKNRWIEWTEIMDLIPYFPIAVAEERSVLTFYLHITLEYNEPNVNYFLFGFL